MDKMNELKQAVETLEACVTELRAAESEESSWLQQDLNRRDGSARQDALHEEFGQDARERVWQAKQKLAAQKKLVSELTKAV